MTIVPMPIESEKKACPSATSTVEGVTFEKSGRNRNRIDAYRVKGAGREQETWHNLHVIYTREAETADMFIERATHELAKNHRVRVVSSDGAEQIIILGNGALRVSARAFEREVRAVEAEIREFLDQ